MQGEPAVPRRAGGKVRHKTFRSGFSTWDSLFDQAAEFASELGPRKLINISHAADRSEGVIVVWYWEN